MRAARPQAFSTPLSQLPQTKHFARGPILDQGQTGTCVAHSLVSKLEGAPIVVPVARCIKPFDLYDRAILVDELPDNDHDTERQMGTTVRAGCKVLQDQGYISSYHWAYSTDDVLQWILSGQGGVVFGIDWYDWMNEPSSEGIIRRTPGDRAHLEGGHAIYCFGADRKLGVVDLQNSWGTSWGGWLGHVVGKAGPRTAESRERIYPGCCRLPLDELEKLLKGNGEAAAIVEQKRVAKTPVPQVA